MTHRTTSLSAQLKKLLAVGVLAATPLLAAAGPQGSNRPYAAACDTSGTVIQTDPILTVSFDLACRSRHLGATTGLLVLEIIPTGPPVNGILPAAISAPVRYVAANGDVLYADFAGTADINVVTGDVVFQGIERFTGGTGRFADASGRSFLEGTASNVTNIGEYTSVGRISY